MNNHYNYLHRQQTKKGGAMKLYHTSPYEIKKINESGVFGDCLFFATERYVMTEAKTIFTYSIEINDDETIHVSDLFDEEEIKRIADVLDIKESDAERVLDGRSTAFDHKGDGEDDWWVQGIQGQVARKMGYKACESRDEQGVVYIISMKDRENELKLENIDAR